jgi:hypothetical protein
MLERQTDGTDDDDISNRRDREQARIQFMVWKMWCDLSKKDR